MIEQFAVLMALGAEFLKTREELQELADADDFRTWLQNDAFPRLLTDSAQALKSLVHLKAQETERFGIILGHLEAIREAVGQSTAKDKWRDRLKPIDRDVLSALLARTRDEPDKHFPSQELADMAGASVAEVKRSVRFLSESGWARCHEFTGGWVASLTSEGIRFAWEATDENDYRMAVQEIAECLPPGQTGIRIGELAEKADVPYALTRVVVETWADQGLLKFVTDYSPPQYDLVLGASESLRRTIGIE